MTQRTDSQRSLFLFAVSDEMDKQTKSRFVEKQIIGYEKERTCIR